MTYKYKWEEGTLIVCTPETMGDCVPCYESDISYKHHGTERTVKTSYPVSLGTVTDNPGLGQVICRLAIAREGVNA